MGEALRFALTTLTVLPLRPGRVDRVVAGRGIALAPLIGAALALFVGALLFVFRHLYAGEFIGSLISAALAVTALAVLTRGLHLDGLADTADGLASYAPPQRALEVMRAGGVGPLGTTTLIFTVLLQTVALTVCIARHRGTESLVLAVLVGRLAVLWSCTPAVPAARTDGLGALVAGTVRRSVALAWTLAVGVEAAVYGRFDSDAGTRHGMLRALVALALGLFATAVLRRHVVRRLGGVTGDVLGALLEVATTVTLLVMASDIPAALRGDA